MQDRIEVLVERQELRTQADVVGQMDLVALLPLRDGFDADIEIANPHAFGPQKCRRTVDTAGCAVVS
jgi:hypothetical protein